MQFDEYDDGLCYMNTVEREKSHYDINTNETRKEEGGEGSLWKQREYLRIGKKI